MCISCDPGHTTDYKLPYFFMLDEVLTVTIQFSSAAQLCLTLCDPMDCSTPGLPSVQFSSVQSLSHVRLFVTPWIAARQASLSITNSRSSLRLTFIESVMPSSHLILCSPLLLLPSILPIIRVFSNESAICIRWPKYWFWLQRQSFQWTPRTGLL